ncbi:MAG: hypothetical protein HC803_10085 [Saprospiraceae bacterium]|nr:hypothetical protein [Saprospiraceae bacterium]
MSHNTEEHLVGYEIRPRFKLETTLSVDELTEKIQTGLNQENAPCVGHVYSGYAKFHLPQEERHYWSPQLNLTYETIDNTTILRGLYGPHPSVWTMFIFFYALIAFIALVILVIGLSYWSLGKPTTILWFVPVLVLVFGSLYFVAYSGQKLGYDQMVTLHHFLEKSTGLNI